MEVTGKLVKKLDLETGISKAGKEWKKHYENNFNKPLIINLI